jgi:hypothetical protein
MSKNARGTFISMAYAGSDYLRDGERVLSNISDYNLTPALTIGLASNIAQFNYRGNHVRTGERLQPLGADAPRTEKSHRLDDVRARLVLQDEWQNAGAHRRPLQPGQFTLCGSDY